MTLETYKESLKQAKLDLTKAIADLGDAEAKAERANKQIAELRQTVTVLSRLCGEPEFVEEDTLGLTEVIRLAYKSAVGGPGMTLQDVKERIDSMGSVHTVTKRLLAKGDVEPAGNVNGKDTYCWSGRSTDPAPDKSKVDRKLQVEYFKQKTRHIL